jgi:hypothetical protein
MIPEQDTLIFGERLIAERDRYAGIPTRLLIGAWPLVGAETLDEGGTRQIIRISVGSCRNFDRLPDSTIRQFGAIAGAGDDAVFDNRRLRDG